MDFLRGIPVEHKLKTYNMPHTGPTLCHPKIGYVDLSVTPFSTLVPFSPLVHINGDNADSPPKIPDTKLHVPQHTLPYQHPATPFRLQHSQPKLHESCSTKSKPYSMVQIKTYFVVLLKKSFVIHLCCLKKYSVREINNFPNCYTFMTY